MKLNPHNTKSTRHVALCLVLTMSFFAAACGSSSSDSPESAADGGAETTTVATTTEAAPTTSVAEATAPTSTEPPTTTEPEGPATIHVPDDYGTIQAAVDSAQPGDLILIAAGVYNEAVNVVTDDLTIRGIDRNKVILDGEFELDNGIRVLGASGVAVENMTARNYTVNGFFWTGTTGYRGSYLTAYRNGDYGVYAFDAVDGQIDNSYASGSPDAGFYIGQCFPCNAVIDNVIAEFNGIGYSGTNSGGNLILANSTFRYNRVGIVPNSGSYELCYPERDTTIIGNLVYSNNQGDTPAIDVALLAMGNGILISGGIDNTVERNRVFDHAKTGIGLVPFLEEDPNDVIPPDEDRDRPCEDTKNDPIPDPDTLPDALLWDSKANTVRDNVVSGSGQGDLALGALVEDPSALTNCWENNTFETSSPAQIEALGPCSGEGSGDWAVDALDVLSWLSDVPPPAGDYKTTPIPPDQPSMPDAETSPAHPATDVPFAIDTDAIEVPAEPA